MSRTIAETIVDMLADAGVKRLYAVTGDSLNLLNDAIRRDGRIDWIHVRHEEAGAYAAMAEGILGGIGCCAGSSGPGHVHLINGLYDAHRWGAPVIALPSTIDRADYGMESFQETDLGMFDGCSWYNELAQIPEQAPRMLQQALQNAITRKGVGVFGYSGDILPLDLPENAIASPVYRPQTVLRPDDGALDDLAKMLSGAKRPFIYGGMGCDAARDQVRELARRLNAPVGWTLKGKMALEHDNPNGVGMTGFIGGRACADAIAGADVVLLLGTDFPWKDFLQTDARIAQVLTHGERLGRRTHVEMGLVGDVRATLDALLPRLETRADDSFLQDRLKAAKDDRDNMAYHAQKPGKKGEISPEYLTAAISRLADDDAIFTADTGMTTVWAARYLESTGKRRFMGSFSHGSMANAMPQAIGAALAGDGRQSIALCGDGGISMLLGDLATIGQYQLPVKMVVYNNSSLGMVEIEMQLAGIPNFQTEMTNPDFAAIAEACGIRGVQVDDPEKLDDALEMAMNHEGPVLLDVKTDRYAVAMPPHTSPEQLGKYALSEAKMVLNGRGTEVIEQLKTNFKYLRDL
ncbi:pyruvate dehydrogenase [Thalassospira profundimaris]|uniref:Pyruvate dehydrogenase n=1 Tax=Thalassospira profundimaris TaxID=502049 RepID=A0A367WUI7_9PROT|nr:thiamine pyrophosphate-dependent enzyme [Thalassospira profundimaris]RCK44181.1 pyruvate dehydrogenase [Thalassospira profundimaris]